MNQQNNIDLIEQYLNNELSESERQEVENQIAADQDLASEFERRQMAHQMLDFMVTENLRDQLKALEAEDTRVISMPARRRRLSMMAIAASVIILIGAFFFIMPGGGSLSNQQLALDLYETPTFTMRGGETENITTQITQGIQALNEKDYTAAIRDLEEVPADNEYYTMARYYLGHAHFLNKNYEAAENDFNEVAGANDIRFNDDAEWFKLLSCKAQNKTCEGLLETILQKPNHTYHQEALELQEKLK
ncbi:MAG: hypothetical protein KDC53_10855 [Saprospiraceae bacterium]|nr:hypothetical protein [Saprospiraceae bacterium]